MIQPENFFGNFFDDARIINSRLYTFGNDCLNRLTANNSGGSYAALITLLTAPLQALNAELGSVDTGLTLQKGKTLSVNAVLKTFKQTMSDKEGLIADKLGGRSTPAYLEFYPNGIDEYSRATKEKMPLLTNRVKVAATANSVALGTPLAAGLQGFEATWATARNAQLQQQGTVEDSRSQRTVARTNVELALLETMHTIGGMFPGNAGQCMVFFDPGLLLAPKRAALNSSGAIAALETKQVFNLGFTESMRLNVRNPDDNATLVVWLAATTTEPANGQSMEIKPGKKIRIPLSDIGDIDNTFLLIKNISAVNEGSYKVRLEGASEFA